MSSNIGGSTLSHRIHNEERSDFDSSNKEFMDNQEDACMTRKEEKDCPENYTGKLITHYEKYTEKNKEYTIVTRVDNGCGMDKPNVYLDPSNSTTKKNQNGMKNKGMLNAMCSFPPNKQVIVTRGKGGSAQGLKLNPKKMVELKDKGLQVDKTYLGIDSELNTKCISHNNDDDDDDDDDDNDQKINWEKLYVKNNGEKINNLIEEIKNGGRGTIQKQIWINNCPITEEEFDKFNKNLTYKKRNFECTYIYNNKNINIQDNNFISNDYHIHSFPFKFKDGKTYIKLGKDILYCSKSAAEMKLYGKMNINFDEETYLNFTIVSKKDSTIQSKNLNISEVGLKKPFIQTPKANLGIGKIEHHQSLTTRTLFAFTEPIQIRTWFQIPLCKRCEFGVTGDKDIPNLKSPMKNGVYQTLFNAFQPLYSGIRNLGTKHGKQHKPEVQNLIDNGLKNETYLTIEKIKDWILNKEKKKRASRSTETSSTATSSTETSSTETSSTATSSTATSSTVTRMFNSMSIQPTDPITQPTDPITPPTDHVTPPSDPITQPTDPITPPIDPITSILHYPVTQPLDPVTPPSNPVTPPSNPVTPPERRRGHISQERREKLWLEQFGDNFNVRCVCESIINPFKANLGHIKAFSMGGSCKDENLYYICKKCNGNDTNPIQNMIEKKYGENHLFYKRLMDGFKRLGKNY